jgi:hypothetical protein
MFSTSEAKYFGVPSSGRGTSVIAKQLWFESVVAQSAYAQVPKPKSPQNARGSLNVRFAYDGLQIPSSHLAQASPNADTHMGFDAHGITG